MEVQYLEIYSNYTEEWTVNTSTDGTKRYVKISFVVGS